MNAARNIILGKADRQKDWLGESVHSSNSSEIQNVLKSADAPSAAQKFELPSLPLLLASIHSPADLRNFSISQLEELADEIRMVLCSLSECRNVHFASNLGVVELAIALHSTFDFSQSRLIWDTGHQCYPHKLLTGRFNQIETIRTFGGLMGYPNPEESPYDLLMTGHAGCSVGTALGLACGDTLLRPEDNRVSVAVVGDGAFASGAVFEALNHAGGLGKKMIVILNDNKMSICGRVGGLGRYLDQFRLTSSYQRMKNRVRRLVDAIPSVGPKTGRIISRVKDGVKASLLGGMLFEEFGFRYMGPIDGHNILLLKNYLRMIQDFREPVLLHILTEKGHGYRLAEIDPAHFHAPSPKIMGKGFGQEANAKFDKESGRTTGDFQPSEEINRSVLSPKMSEKSPDAQMSEEEERAVRKLAQMSRFLPNDDNWDMPGEHSYTHWARNAIYRLMKEDERVCVITAAMAQGTMLEPIREAFPKRFFDVGICEEHAVVFAAGLAKSGMRPIVDIYSTFLQRAYDQIFQEVSLQNLPVILMIDRAGIVGADGPTHHGVFDLAYLRPFPNLRVLAPGDSYDLEPMLKFAVAQDSPTAIRYPRTTAARIPRPSVPIEIGKAEILRSGRDGYFAALGSPVETALEVAEYFGSLPDANRIDLGVINARFLKPLDKKTLLGPVQEGKFLITLEEGVLAGGFGSALLEAANEMLADTRLIKRLGIPDAYVPHGTRNELLTEVGLDRSGLIRAVLEMKEESPVSGTSGEQEERPYFIDSPASASRH